MSNTKVKQEGWREVKLGEVAEIVGGGTPSTKEPKYWNGSIPWLTPRDLSNFSGRYISGGERNISEMGLLKSSSKLLPKDTVLLTTRAPIGYLAIAENEISTNQGFRSLVAKEQTDSLFLFYLLKQNVKHLKSQSSGTTFGELAGSTLKSLSFLFPPLPEQKAIAEVLSSLDDKIDLLHRQNKTLEDMAQTLFRHWFVENSPPVEGWQSERTDGVVSPLERYQAEPDEVVPQRSTKDYLSLPYNPKLKKRASELRKAGNLCEVLLWEQMKSGKLKGLDFDRQKIIGNYIVDFYCASLGLVIEIDGISHDDKEKYDSERDAFLERLGLTVIHIADKDVREDLAGVMEFLSECVACEGEERPPRQASPATPPQEGNYPASGLPRQGRGMGIVGRLGNCLTSLRL